MAKGTLPGMAHAGLLFELMVLFIGLPAAYRLAPVRIPALPVLWLAAGYACWQLARDPGFDRGQLWNPAPLGSQFASILAIFVVVAALQWAGVHWLAPKLEWSLARRHTRVWAMVILLYPVLSVYPQALLYRAFFMHRYAVLFPATPQGGLMLVVASATVFGGMHIVFRNPLAVVLTFLGGLLFAWRYQHTGSLFVSSVEHALYGCWLFTVGLGQYFYHGVWPKPQ
ncbi:CPBP family intramembrane glutamic endopeptidase [Terriglobus albidus]|uniref:CPBP family intramembrane glutamic endopeptidase n=1 Tax=Terriglobus albidus TaxID=1592106 RepID=UPI0021DF92E2|nr:CPBP family intramembrane glutamic endopeptidase [Terriglobus albidus]